MYTLTICKHCWQKVFAKLSWYKTFLFQTDINYIKLVYWKSYQADETIFFFCRKVNTEQYYALFNSGVLHTNCKVVSPNTDYYFFFSFSIVRWKIVLLLLLGTRFSQLTPNILETIQRNMVTVIWEFAPCSRLAEVLEVVLAASVIRATSKPRARHWFQMWEERTSSLVRPRFCLVWNHFLALTLLLPGRQRHVKRRYISTTLQSAHCKNTLIWRPSSFSPPRELEIPPI